MNYSYYLLGDGPNRTYVGLKTNCENLSEGKVQELLARNGAADFDTLRLLDMSMGNEDSFINWTEYFF